jgi:hypothetical protein
MMRLKGKIEWKLAEKIEEKALLDLAKQMIGKPITVQNSQFAIGLIHDTLAEEQGIIMDVEIFDVSVGVITKNERLDDMALFEVNLLTKEEKEKLHQQTPTVTCSHCGKDFIPFWTDEVEKN